MFNTMQSIKGGWVGQAFALAKGNDSGGRKSRIRRSKEERKAMVESFIKKYQNSNNGNFPSLNLTHKEVGGSFYTVREIVREIIQENRVLGPAKLTPEEQNADSFFEQYPLGSISMEPQVHVVSSNGSHIITTPISYNHQHSTSEAKDLESNAQCPEPQHSKLDNEKTVNGSTHVAERKQESSESLHRESPAMKCLEGEENVEKELAKSEAKIPKITDFMVEAFPLRPVTDTIIDLDGDSGKPSVFAGTLEEKEIINMELEAVNNCPVLETYSSLVHEESDIQAESPMSERSCVNDKAEPSLESLKHSTIQNSNVLEVNDDATDLEIKEILPAETNALSPPNGIENLNGTISSSLQGQSISEEVDAINEESDIWHGGSSQTARRRTLDRINLESWEATTDRPTGPDNNSLLAFIKAFINAFMKFWSE